MTTLTQQLELLKEQQEELEKRIQEEKEHKKKLNNDASVERLEALVKPLSNYLEQKRLEQLGQLSNLKKLIDINNIYIKTSQKWKQKKTLLDVRTKRMIIFSTKQQFETLYEIIKKQDERIKELEKKIG